MAEAKTVKSSKERGTEHSDPRQQRESLQTSSWGPYSKILGLHRAAGNRAVGELLQSSVSRARHIADQEEVGKGMCAPSGTGGHELDSRLALLRHANADLGNPLDENVRVPLEQNLGVSLNSVRVHSGPASEAAAKSIAARAYTIGSNIHLGSRARNVSALDRRALLAHEAVHTVQQGGRPVPLEGKIQLSHLGGRSEVEAARIGETVTSMSVNQNLQPALTFRKHFQVTPVAPRTGSGVVIQRQQEKEKEKKKAKEDWNFTPADYAALIKKKGKLKIADDSSWFPKALQGNLLNTLNSLLDPTRTPSATEGVNVADFFHGHVGVTIRNQETELPTDIKKKQEAFRNKAIDLSMKISDTKGKVTEKTSIDWNEDQEKVHKLAQELLSETLKSKGVVVIYHTFELNDPRDLVGKPKVKTGAGKDRSLAMGAPRRNYITPLDTNKPGQYFPPEEDNASSWREEGGMHTHGDFFSVMQFNFLIDNKGEVHVRADNPNTLTGDAPSK